MDVEIDLLQGSSQQGLRAPVGRIGRLPYSVRVRSPSGWQCRSIYLVVHYLTDSKRDAGWKPDIIPRISANLELSRHSMPAVNVGDVV